MARIWMRRRYDRFMLTPPLAALAEERFVLLTTFRRTGVPVATPVWIVRDGERLLITSPSAAGKVKRLRHTAAVELVACSFRGIMREGATVVSARARVDDSTDAAETMVAALMAKYGLPYRVLHAFGRLQRHPAPFSVIVVEAVAATGAPAR